MNLELLPLNYGVACKSWHGSLNPSDSYVPLIVTYPGGDKSVMDAIINGTTCKGSWCVPDLIKKITDNLYISQ